MSGWQKGSRVLRASAAASPPQLLREGGLRGAYPPCSPFPGQELFPGAKSPVGKGSRLTQLLGRQMQWRGEEILLFASFLSISELPLCSLCRKCRRSHVFNKHKTRVVSGAVQLPTAARSALRRLSLGAEAWLGVPGWGRTVSRSCWPRGGVRCQ